MSKSIDDLDNKAAEVAAKEHITVEFIESRARLFNREEFERALSEIPDVEPEAHDRL